MSESSRPASQSRDDDAAVEAEWRRVEAERIAQEQAEAQNEAPEATKEKPGRHWLWPALFASLVAGALVAVAVNSFSLWPMSGAAVGTDARPAGGAPPAAGVREK